MSRNKIGLFFGSFNPIHNGHVEMAKYCIDNKLVDQVCFIPAKQNPYKSEYEVGFGGRCQMINYAINDLKSKGYKHGAFMYSSCEQSLSGYTCDTLCHESSSYPNDEIIIICGEDSYNQIYGWREGQWIMDNYKFIVFDRNEPIIDCNDNIIEKISLDSFNMLLSSSFIRGMINLHADDWKKFVPESVAKMIESNKWYTEASDKPIRSIIVGKV